MASQAPKIDSARLATLPRVERLEPDVLEPEAEPTFAPWPLSARLLGLAWFVGIIVASSITPSAAAEMPTPTWLTVLGETSAWLWLGFVTMAASGAQRTAAAGVGLGALMGLGLIGCATYGHAAAAPGVFAVQAVIVTALAALSLRSLTSGR